MEDVEDYRLNSDPNFGSKTKSRNSKVLAVRKNSERSRAAHLSQTCIREDQPKHSVRPDDLVADNTHLSKSRFYREGNLQTQVASDNLMPI